MSTSPAAVMTQVPWAAGTWTDRAVRSWGDGHLHVHGRPGRGLLDGDLVHEGAHQADAVPAERVGRGPGGPPAARVRDGQPEPGDRGLGPEPDGLPRGVAVAVLDGVGAGFPGGDQDVLNQPAGPATAAPPRAARLRARAELPPALGERHIERLGVTDH